MKASRVKSSRWILVSALALAFALVVALPALASAEESSGDGGTGIGGSPAEEGYIVDVKGGTNLDGDGNVGQNGKKGENGEGGNREGAGGEGGEGGNHEGAGGEGGEHGEGGPDVHSGEGGPENEPSGDPYDMNNVSVSANTLIETGQPVSGVVKASRPGGPNGPGYVLVEGTDFTVQYFDGSHNQLPNPPSTAGVYFAKVTGIEPFHGEKEVRFEIVSVNSLNRPDIKTSLGRKYYTYTGQQVVPDVTVILDEVTLVKDRDYVVLYMQGDPDGHGDQSSEPSATAPTEEGRYRVTLRGIGSYKDEYQRGDLWFEIVPDDKIEYCDCAFEGQVSGLSDLITVTLENGKANPPKVVITSPSGAVLTEGTDYTLKFYKQGTYGEEGSELDGVTEEGVYGVILVGQGKYANSSKRCENMAFCATLPEHDITKAASLKSTELAYDGGNPINGAVEENVVVVLNGETLTLGQDYYLRYDRSYTGMLGIHEVEVRGSALEREDGTYYGSVRLSYGVWNETAPAANTRVDSTGVKVSGSTISDNSTCENKSWVSLKVDELDESQLDDDVVQAYDVQLIYSTRNSNDGPMNTQNLTSDLDITLTFPVGSEYNGMTATITQIHDGEAMSPTTATVTDGVVSVKTDRLSQFLISVAYADEGDSNDKGDNGTNGSGDKADKSGSNTDNNTSSNNAKASSSTTPATGDTTLSLAIAVLAMIALAAACVVCASKDRLRG